MRGFLSLSKRKNKGIYLPFFKRWLWWNNQLITCQAPFCSGKIKFKDLVCIKKWIGSLEANNQCFSRTICFQFILKPFSNWRRIQDGLNRVQFVFKKTRAIFCVLWFWENGAFYEKKMHKRCIWCNYSEELFSSPPPLPMCSSNILIFISVTFVCSEICCVRST